MRPSLAFPALPLLLLLLPSCSVPADLCASRSGSCAVADDRRGFTAHAHGEGLWSGTPEEWGGACRAAVLALARREAERRGGGGVVLDPEVRHATTGGGLRTCDAMVSVDMPRADPGAAAGAFRAPSR
jgi:hypothetical protein